MSDHPKKNQHKKGKDEPKEQRKKPVQKHKVVEKKEPTKKPEKPKHDEPGPEFYKNLKRETDDILKITEEENARYHKKEIQSNWKKYEIPIDTYDDYEEQESMGEDYEQLIQASLSTGGHFQFNHEKSWDSITTPSEYDKYFDVNAKNLTIALSSIPFYERNDLTLDMFTETDINTMKSRASKFKQRYDNEIIGNSIITAVTEETKSSNESTGNADNAEDKFELKHSILKNEQLDDEIKFKYIPQDDLTSSINKKILHTLLTDDNDDTEIFDTLETPCIAKENTEIKLDQEVLERHIKDIPEVIAKDLETRTSSIELEKNHAIETPEDLEKWLDDFLDN